MDALIFTILAAFFAVLIFSSFVIRRREALRDDPRAKYTVKDFHDGFDVKDKEAFVFLVGLSVVSVVLWILKAAG